MTDTILITLNSSEKGRKFLVPKDRLAKIPYFGRLFESSWADTDSTTFQIEPCNKSLQYKIEEILFVYYLQSNWTIDPVDLEADRSQLPVEELQLARYELYSWPWPTLVTYPAWLASSRNTIADLIALYKLADFYEVTQVSTAVEALLCNRWRETQRVWINGKPNLEDDIETLKAYIEASQIVCKRGLLLWIMTSITDPWYLCKARLPWIETSWIPGLSLSGELLANIIILPTDHCDYILQTMKEIDDSIDHQQKLSEDQLLKMSWSERYAFFDARKKLERAPLLSFLFIASRMNGYYTPSRHPPAPVNPTFTRLLNPKIEEAILRDISRLAGHDDLYHSRHCRQCYMSLLGVQAVLAGLKDSSLLSHIGGRQLAWVVHFCIGEGLRHYLPWKHALPVLLKLDRLLPSLIRDAELLMLSQDEIDRLEDYVLQELNKRGTRKATISSIS